MNKLIMITGSVASPFFLNELPMTKQYYDDVSIIEFSGNKAVGDFITNEYSYKVFNCKPNVFRRGFIRDFFKWLRRDYVKKEISQYASLSVKGIKRLAYILFYGFYYAQSKHIIDKEIDACDGQVDIYAYWLSRPAFIAAQYRERYCDKVRRIFSRAHGYDLYTERNSQNYLPFRHYIDSKLDVIYFISENGKRYYETRYPDLGATFSANRKVSRIGVYDTGVRKQQLDKKDTIVFASCSGIIHLKRLDLIVAVMDKLSKSYNIRWIHFGDGKLMKEITDQCRKQLKTDSYRLYGKIDNKKLLPVYGEEDIDFFINLSDTEGIPVSIMEAMSFGVPVIARNVGGVGEIVTSENGLLLNSGNADEIANSVMAFLNKVKADEDLYQELCMNAYNTWHNQYNADSNYQIFYNDVLSENLIDTK